MSLNTPSLFTLAFGQNNPSYRNTIGTSSNPPYATLNDGFPAVTMEPITSGGVPPAGQDFNGILYWITQAIQWEQAGGQYTFNAAFATSVGGYPLGAQLLKANGTGMWVNQVANNSNNPDTGGSGWASIGFNSVNQSQINNTFSGNSIIQTNYWVNSTSGLVTVGMPVAPYDQQWVRFADVAGQFSLHNLVLTQASASGTASFTASIATNVLTVTGTPTGTIGLGQLVAGAGVAANTYIIGLGTGTGAAGTYILGNSQTVSSESMTTTTPAATIMGLTQMSVGIPYIDFYLTFNASTNDWRL